MFLEDRVCLESLPQTIGMQEIEIFLKSPHWPNFSAIVYIAVRIYVMFDYMNHNIGFFP